MDGSLTTPPKPQNADVAWDQFDSVEYHRRNYSNLLPEDRQLLDLAGDFLIDHFAGQDPVGDAVDVGAGTNLYPALLMLPWASRIALFDVAASNVDWLAQNVRYDPDSPWLWESFWEELAQRPGYREVRAPRMLLAANSRVDQVSIFDLEQAAWDLGTMFFVADGMTSSEAEFADGIACFLRSLRPGSPFIAAFMRQSEGYQVSGQALPAVSVDHETLEGVFAHLNPSNLRIQATKPTHQVVRSGYKGMLLVTGLAG